VQDALAYIEELEERDGALDALIAELARLEAEVGSIRERAAAAERVLEELPGRRTELLDHHAAAQAEQDRRSHALADAQAELQEAERRGSEERIAAARRGVARAEERAAAGAARLERIAAEREALELEAAAASRELPELAKQAADAAARLRVAPRITQPLEPGEDLLDWAGRARAALFVARTGLEREREQVVREAVELGTAALGEPVYGSTVASVRRRLEDATATS
jgi:chromosome segregation ATPase